MKFDHIHIGEVIKDEVKRQGVSFASFGESIGIQRQNVNKKIFSQKSLNTDLLIEISEKLGCNFFDFFQSGEKCNQKGLHGEVRATLTVEFGEKKQDRAFRFLFGENDIQIVDNKINDNTGLK
ncbi:MAG: hypothetical protein LBH58_09820 [Tannerellaceae bacterium]|jgi:transcriptional regulator with XRE-family HTH domain|nr:hypothetical protein [Tannerellaceae bacterium]